MSVLLGGVEKWKNSLSTKKKSHSSHIRQGVEQSNGTARELDWEEEVEDTTSLTFEQSVMSVIPE